GPRELATRILVALVIVMTFSWRGCSPIALRPPGGSAASTAGATLDQAGSLCNQVSSIPRSICLRAAPTLGAACDGSEGFQPSQPKESGANLHTFIHSAVVLRRN